MSSSQNKVYFLSGVGSTSMNYTAGIVSFNFIGCYAAHSSGKISSPFFRTATVQPGWFAYLSTSGITPVTDADGNVIYDTSGFYNPSGTYNSPTENFYNNCNIFIYTAPMTLMNTVNPGDVICINYETGLYVNESVVDPTLAERAYAPLLLNWSAYTDLKAYSNTICASLGYTMYMDISALKIDTSVLDSSWWLLDSSVKILDSSLKELYNNVQNAISNGAEFDSYVMVNDYLDVSGRTRAYGRLTAYNGIDVAGGGLSVTGGTATDSLRVGSGSSITSISVNTTTNVATMVAAGYTFTWTVTRAS